eukprot:760543-Hanusia_phi.AAC.4
MAGQSWGRGAKLGEQGRGRRRGKRACDGEGERSGWIKEEYLKLILRYNTFRLQKLPLTRYWLSKT